MRGNSAALKKSGDNPGAVMAYRKSLDLNPRVSADDKAAAAVAEKAVAELNGH